jgi:8-oxo-dGTP pyrophosphatase MutT (NUDIX family)
MSDADLLPDVHWGNADTPLPDWREDETEQVDPDDEELAETPPDVIDMLGFDPLDAEDDETDARVDSTQSDTRTDAIGDPVRAAGVLLINHADDGERVLFVRHADRGTWEFPGGGIEDGETAEEAATREVSEEIGATPYGRLSLLMRDRLTGVDYSTFIGRTASMIEPNLSDELTDWQWAKPNEPPEPLHPGVRLSLARLGMNELDLARAIAGGTMSSPQQYENLWLFALRITGTGVSYRPELEEYVWRDPSIYLNADFLARSNGLAVIWQHPEGDELNQTEFENRIIGAIMLPYLFTDEVWGVAKVYDQNAAQMMLDHGLSTSPAVIFRDPSVNETRKLAGNKTLLIEGEPSLLDHLAICELGVWDKGGEATGVAVGEPEMADQETETPEARADSVAVRDPLDDLLDAFNAFTARVDRFEDQLPN